MKKIRGDVLDTLRNAEEGVLSKKGIFANQLKNHEQVSLKMDS